MEINHVKSHCLQKFSKEHGRISTCSWATAISLLIPVEQRILNGFLWDAIVHYIGCRSHYSCHMGSKELEQDVFLYLGRADKSSLVFTPVHAKHFIAMSFQSSPSLHDELAESIHLLCNLVHWEKKQVLNRPRFTLPLIVASFTVALASFFATKPRSPFLCFSV